MILTENDDILKFAIESGMIDISTVRDAIKMKQKEEILNNHPYKIYEGKDGFWHTYIQETNKRKQIKRKTKEKVEEAVYQYWAKKENTELVFKERFEDWLEYQKRCGIKNNSIKKYKADYKRFFGGREIEQMHIDEIKEDILSETLIKAIDEKGINRKAFFNILGNLNGIFDKAVRDKIIPKDDNPMIYLDVKIIKAHCTIENKRTKESRYLDETERKRLLSLLNNPTTANNNYVIDRAIELAYYTGMRVGELAGLMWSDIDYGNGYIIIRHSERYDPETREYSVSDTKNHKIRYFPITEEITDVLERNREFQKKHNLLGEYVFNDFKGKVHFSKISSNMFRKTRHKEVFRTNKSIHALRRTLNSNMRCNGVPTMVAASLLGHTEKVNEINYTIDVSTKEQKYDAIKKATSF